MHSSTNFIFAYHIFVCLWTTPDIVQSLLLALAQKTLLVVFKRTTYNARNQTQEAVHKANDLPAVLPLQDPVYYILVIHLYYKY